MVHAGGRPRTLQQIAMDAEGGAVKSGGLFKTVKRWTSGHGHTRRGISALKFNISRNFQFYRLDDRGMGSTWNNSSIRHILGGGLRNATRAKAFFIERKEKAERASHLSYETEVRYLGFHRYPPISHLGDGLIVRLKITNQGADTAKHCSGRLLFLSMEEESSPLATDETLNWEHFNLEDKIGNQIRISPYDSVGIRIQELYCKKRNIDLIFQKPDFLEICFTLKDHQHAYMTTCGSKEELSFGTTYGLSIQVVGDGLTEKPRNFKLDCQSWEHIHLTEEKN